METAISYGKCFQTVRTVQKWGRWDNGRTCLRHIQRSKRAGTFVDHDVESMLDKIEPAILISARRSDQHGQ